MDVDDLYFELSDSGDLVRIEPEKRLHSGSELDWDNNWIKTQVSVKGGRFSGQFDAEFMTMDFEQFKWELNALYNNLKGKAHFSTIEGQLELKIAGDGLGHFAVDIFAQDRVGTGGELTFSMSFDQTILKELVRQLDRIAKHFPVTGDFNIKIE